MSDGFFFAHIVANSCIIRKLTIVSLSLRPLPLNSHLLLPPFLLSSLGPVTPAALSSAKQFLQGSFMGLPSRDPSQRKIPLPPPRHLNEAAEVAAHVDGADLDDVDGRRGHHKA